MGGKRKRTSAPAPMEFPRQHPPPIPSAQQPLPMQPYGLGTWGPTPSSTSCPPWWRTGLVSSSPQGSSWMAGSSWRAAAGSSPGSSCMATLSASQLMPSLAETENDDDSEVQAWGPNPYPPGGFVSFMNSATNPAALVSSGSKSQAISIADDDNDGKYGRTEKRILWTKQEDLRLVSAWINSSNDPIQANYKKNDQYWKGVADVYNSTTPKNRVRQVKQIKDHFGRIKKRVQWFCGCWKEANALWASGESDADIEKKAMKSYEEEHKKDGPFMFKHCWEVLRKEPKWEAYLERLENLEADKRKFCEDEDVEKSFSLDDDADERPIGGKKAKEQLKKKKKGQPCIINLEDELNNFLDAQKTANEGRKEMLETQRRVSSENLEARKLAHLEAKERKETVMLETYQALLMKETTSMPEDVRSEHVWALKCLREKLFNIND